jgi:Tfp pilus assembly protein PilF
VPYYLFEKPTWSTGKTVSKAKQAAMKALELDNTIADAHTAVGIIREMYDWDWQQAEEAFRRAIALNPSNREAHREYGFFLCRTGRMETGLAEMKRTYTLDPLSEAVNTSVAWAYIWNHQYDEAIEHCQKALTFYPNSAFTYFNLGEAYLLKREYEKAISVLETELMASSGWDTRLGYLGCAYALSGNRNKALELLENLQQQQKRGIDATVIIAFIYTGLGETDQALTLLEQAYEEHSLEAYPHHIFDPIFDSLHSEPRFQALLKKLGLRP